MLRLALLVGVIAVAQPAQARELDPIWGFAAGLATAMVPLAVGGGITAGSDSQTAKYAGIYVIAGGLALAPLVSHAMHREWKRGLAFGAVPVACGAAVIGLLAGQENLLDGGGAPPRIAFGALLAIELFASAVGLIDSFMYGERRPRRAVSLVPLVGRGQVGLVFGGAL
jgi:hypothetical protein